MLSTASLIVVFIVDTNGGRKGPILLDSVNCSGSESRLSQCSSQGWNNHNCYHYNDIRINCSGLYNDTLKLLNNH